METSLRLAIRHVLGDAWQSSINDLAQLENKREEDRRRRDGAIVNDDLLSYVEFYHLSKIIKDKWNPHFAAVFKEQKRTEVFLGVLEDVRNAIAHSRELLQFERELVAGISGHLRNQVTIYRTSSEPVAAHYPLIESVVDNFGSNGFPVLVMEVERPRGALMPRLEVGDIVSFTCQGSDVRGRELEWHVLTEVERFKGQSSAVTWQRGSPVVIDWQPGEEHVSESLVVYVRTRAADARFRRKRDLTVYYLDEYDDVRTFYYAVNPPPD